MLRPVRTGRLLDIPFPTLYLLGGDSPGLLQDATRRLCTPRYPVAASRRVPAKQHVAIDTITEAFVAFVRRFAAGRHSGGR